MKRAIVFAGGGTKGAYQVGVVKAIRELGIHFDIVTGTSIGALNGCLLAQNDDEAMFKLWENLDLDDIMEDGMDLKFTFENMVNQVDLIKPFLKSYFNHKGANIEPLKEKINTLCNEEKLNASPIDFGLVTVEYPSLKPWELTKKEMKGKLQEYLLASASCFPAFPIQEIDGNHFIDGGYFDNLPIDLAFNMGADEVIAVELTYERHTHPHYENRPNITVIRPTQYNGQFLDFDKGMLNQRMILGYHDALKALGHYIGCSYTFKPYENEDLARRFYQSLLKYEGHLNRSFIKRNSKIINRIPLSTLVYEKYPHASMQEYLLTAIEQALELFEIDPFQIYELDEIINRLKNEFNQELQDFQKIKIEELKDIDSLYLKEALESLSKKDLIAFLYEQKNNDPQKFYDNWIFPFFPKEMLCALLMEALCI